MFRRVLILAALALGSGVSVSAQGFRIGDDLTVTSSLTSTSPITPLQATINVCVNPANAVPCTNKASTFTSVTLATPCSTATQVVLAGTTTCVAQTDVRGNWGAWVAAGNYDVTFTLSTGQSFGPFTISVGIPAGSTILPGTVNSQNINGTLIVGNAAGQYSTLAAAFAALPAGGGKIRIAAGQPITLTAAITISTPTTEIECEGPFSGINVNMTGDVFLVQQDEFRVKNCYISITTTSSRLNAALFAGGSPNTHGARMQLIDSVIVGNATSTNNGQIQRCTGTSGNGCEEWEIRNTKIQGPGTWQNAQIITNSSNVLTADTFTIMGLRQVGTANATDGWLVYDGMIDTVNVGNGTILRTSGTGNDLITRNTVGAPVEFPRWVHCEGAAGCEFEGGGAAAGVTAVNFITGKDLRMTGYIASAQVGVAIGATVFEASVEDTIFANIGQQAVTIANGAVKTSVQRNRFDSTSVNAATFNTIDIAANTTDFRIIGNTWRNAGANQPLRGINIAAGTSASFVIAGNVIGAASFAGSFFSNGASGGNQNVYGNDAVGADFFITQTAQANGNFRLGGILQNTAVTATMGLTLKKGSGGGNYTTASTTFVVVDSTNLCFTVTIPTGWKLEVQASGSLTTATAAVTANVALSDNAACGTANAGILQDSGALGPTTAAGNFESFGLSWIITGDGASHNIALQYKTSNAADSATLLNASASQLPTMTFVLMPSN